MPLDFSPIQNHDPTHSTDQNKAVAPSKDTSAFYTLRGHLPYRVHVRDGIDVKTIRSGLKLTQVELAGGFGFPLSGIGSRARRPESPPAFW